MNIIRPAFLFPMLLTLLCSLLVAQAPTITSFTPTSGIPGTLITINGTNFDRDANGVVWTGTIPYRVVFPMSGGLTNAMPTFVSATQIRATVPAAAVTGPFSIRQGFTLIASSPGSFTVIQRPRINSFSPTSGPIGTTVTISGSNFNRDLNGNVWSGAIPWRVRFGGNLDVVPTFVSAFAVTAVVPQGTTSAQLRLVQNGTVMSTSSGSFTVAPPTTLRLVNNAQYDMVSLTLNGTQRFAQGAGVLVGSTVDLTGITAGTYTLVAGIGFYSANGTRDIWFRFTRTVTIAANAITTQTFAPLTIGQLLTMGAATRDWTGVFFDNNGIPHSARFRITSTGGWTFFVDNATAGTGALTLLSWPARSPTVSFRINNSVPATTISFPFATFLLQNGPPSWPLIQYVRQ
ncbi:MAG: IPT/TIG domain-containing protein [Planctomycetes bacterium]|nr:IPT/TIG domain-containing protein [Planctomycetota bacterium]